MIRNIITIGAFIALAVSGVFAQSTGIGARLTKAFSVEELRKLQEEDPEEFRYITFCADSAFTIMPFPKEKGMPNEIKGEIVIEDLEHINFYDLNKPIIKDDWQYYTIKGTDKLLVIYSEDYIKKYLLK